MVHEKVLYWLKQGGEDGVPVGDIAAVLYGRSDSTTRGRANQIIQNLRRKGFAIRTDVAFDGKRYVRKYILLPEAAPESKG